LIVVASMTSTNGFRWLKAAQIGECLARGHETWIDRKRPFECLSGPSHVAARRQNTPKKIVGRRIRVRRNLLLDDGERSIHVT
jgi:hypothetical protein